MGLFDQILSAVNDSSTQGSPGQISDILNTVNSLASDNRIDPAALPLAMSVIGKYLRPNLQEKRLTEGDSPLENLVDQFGGTEANSELLTTVFSSPEIQNIIQEVQNKTGMNTETIESLLPSLLPLVLGFFKTGASNSGNSLLSNFLDSDGDGDVDIADAMKMASKYFA